MAADRITIHNLTSGVVPLSRGIILRQKPVSILQQDLIEYPYLAQNLAGSIRRGLVSAVTSEGEGLTPARVLELSSGIHAHTHDSDDGFDPVPIPEPIPPSYVPPTSSAVVQTTDVVGDLVIAIPGGGIPSMTRANAEDPGSMPVTGVIVSKESPTEATVQFSGPVDGIYTGLTQGQTYFVGANGRPTLTPPEPPFAGVALVQPIGVALTSSILMLSPQHVICERAFDPVVEYELWSPLVTPAGASGGGPWELGTRFFSDSGGLLTKIRFHKPAGVVGLHTVKLWSSVGVLLFSETLASETASGWQEHVLSTPISILSGTQYVVSYNTDVGNGNFSHDLNYFTSQYNAGPLHVPVDGGKYNAPPGIFPVNAFQASNYWITPVVAI
jgi:hypothetical protein